MNINDELLDSLIGGDEAPVDDSSESVMRWFLRNYGTYKGAVVQLSTGMVLSKQLARDEWGAKYTFQVPRDGGDGMRSVNPVDQLFRELDRVEIHRFGMWPQSPYGYIGDGCFNYFTGWLRKPVYGGDVSLWFNFVDHVLVDIPGAADYFHDWIAHMVCRPWQKHHTFITLAGKSGTGKSLLGRSIAEMLGSDDTDKLDRRAPPTHLAEGEGFLGHFNKQLQGKLFMVIDELGSNKAKHVDTMKHLVTSAKFELTAKYQDTVLQDNYCNFLLTTNHSTALLVDENSRRDVIFNVQQDNPELIQRLASVLVPWQQNGGYETMLAWYFERGMSEKFEFSYLARAPRFLGFERNVFESKNDNTIICDAFCDAIREFGKPVALNQAQIEAILTGLGFQVRGQQFSRVLNSRPEFIESRLVKSKGKVTRCTLCAVPGTLSISVSSQEALRHGLELCALYVDGNISSPF